MAKARKGSKENPITMEDLENIDQRKFKIVEAIVNDGFCNYKYEIINGIGTGSTHAVTDKKNLVHDDLLTAFAGLRVHMAAIDKVFKLSEIETEDINHLNNDPLTGDFKVNGIKLKDKKGFETVELIGEKFVDIGWSKLTSPEVSMDNLGGYDWYEDLLVKAKAAREEVARYAEGKYAPKIETEEKPNKKQGNIFESGEEKKEVSEEEENELMGAKM